VRVTHLTDEELQVYLDRWRPRNKHTVREAPSIEDVETYQHIEHCPRCQADLALYRQLYRELEVPSQARLPRGFARKTTWSLPPFAAMRTRARLQAGLTTGAIALLVMIWVFSRIEWVVLVARGLTAVSLKLHVVTFWASLLWQQLPLPSAPPQLHASWNNLQGALERAFTADPGLLHFTLMALLAAVLVGYADRLFARIPERFRLW